MDSKSLFASLTLAVFLVGPCFAFEECDVKQQRRCRQGLVQELDKRRASEDLDDTRKMEVHCRKLREKLNCLVLQVTQCPTPNRSGDLIQRAWKYLQDNCDTFGGWWSYECFHLEQVKKCEKIFALRDAAVTHASCREYDRFRHCIGDVLTKHCDEEDVLSAGNYLLDSAGEMTWTCPHSAEPELPPVVDQGFVGLTKKPSLLADKLHPSDQHLPPIAILPAGPTPKKVDLSGKIAVEESHLRGVYTASLTGEAPFVTGCNARATEEMRGCLDRHQYERDQALGARDDEDRLRKECCATWNYRRCLQNAVRIHCYDTREVDVQSAIDVIPHDRGFLCRNHWIYSCNGAANATKSQLAAAAICTLLTIVLNKAALGMH